MTDKDKTQVTPEPAAELPKKAGSKKLLLFGGIGAGILVVGVVLALFVLKPMLASDSEESTPTVEQSEEATAAHATKPEQPKKGRKTAHGDPVVMAIKDIVVNPAGTAGSRFLSASFGFELQSEQAAKEFELREPVVRDVLITILSSKSLAELTDAKQKEIMRVQIRKRIAQVLQTEDLTGVYYTDFVLQ